MAVNGGQQLEVAAGRQIRHAFEHAHLRRETHDVARNRRPDDALVLALDVALNLESPAVHLAARRGRDIAGS